MPLDPATIQELARALDEAERSRVQLRHFSQRFPGMTIGDGYAVQRAWMDIKRAAGRVAIGRKIGLTSRAMQRAVNITEPDYGMLLDDMLFETGGMLPTDRFIEPRVEVELAFVLRHALRGPGCTILDVLNATDFVVPALEIIDARIFRFDPDTKASRRVTDTISDNAADAGIVMGGRPMRPDAVDLRWVCALLHRNSVIEETGVAAGVLNHPAQGVAWLANRLAPHGEALEPGQIILGGSFTAPVLAAPGDSFYADYGPFGSIAVQFTK